MNSEALRAAYTACLPLLSEYYTDLAQSEPLYRAYQYIREHEAASLDAVQLAVLEHALRDFRLAGVALAPERKARFKAVMSELSLLQSQIRGAGARCHQRLVASRDRRGAAQGHQPRHRGAGGAARRSAGRARLGSGARPAHLRGRDHGRRIGAAAARVLRSLEHARVRSRARARAASTTRRSWKTSCGCATRRPACSISNPSPSTRSPIAWRTRCPRWSRSCGSWPAAARASALAELAELEAFAGPRARRLGHHLLLRAPAAEPLPGVAGGIARVPAAAARPGRPVRGRRAPLRRADRRSATACRCGIRTCATSRCAQPTARRSQASTSMPTRAPNKRSGAWMDECVGRMQLEGALTLPVAYLVCNSLPPQDRPAGAADAR